MITYQFDSNLYCAEEGDEFLSILKTCNIPSNNLVKIGKVIFEIIQYIADISNKKLKPYMDNVKSGIGVVQFKNQDLIDYYFKNYNNIYNSNPELCRYIGLELYCFNNKYGILYSFCKVINVIPTYNLN